MPYNAKKININQIVWTGYSFLFNILTNVRCSILKKNNNSRGQQVSQTKVINPELQLGTRSIDTFYSSSQGCLTQSKSRHRKGR